MWAAELRALSPSRQLVDYTRLESRTVEVVETCCACDSCATGLVSTATQCPHGRAARYVAGWLVCDAGRVRCQVEVPVVATPAAASADGGVEEPVPLASEEPLSRLPNRRALLPGIGRRSVQFFEGVLEGVTTGLIGNSSRWIPPRNR